MDLHKLVVDQLSMGERIDYIICDEAQFYESQQIEQLARIVDGLSIDVYAFGILADFRTKLFPGSARLVELADRVNTLQVEALCWCGSRATHNARTVGGVMVVEGEQVVVGDVSTGADVAYEVLCRRHHMRQVTARVSGAAHTSSIPLPFKEKRCYSECTTKASNGAIANAGKRLPTATFLMFNNLNEIHMSIIPPTIVIAST
jgi:thymidine kinase